ncbi:IAA acetyltransferase/MarR transcriptional regulatory protein [Legionella busanensis]|uniref:IAA acetyltransferase/MarR transcriptional regulatory protein n=1 Tax=Legionella busanensis TaxID=190655 RepID=A0A378JU82_9GAMM|nr:GNAT family N-acetyltransferase [Legionella busanensis]STX51762.1 IAA acetyltransferase/MarR transcriptional regulatory protein [Legionella busanensis]
MKDIQVVTYQEHLKDQVIKLISSIQQQEFNIPLSIEDQPDLLNILNYYQVDNGNFWCAIIDSHVIGTIGLIDIGNGQGVLRKMFVAKNYRGKEQGIAQLLLNKVLGWCADRQIDEIYLGTVSIFIAAQKFYLKNGFSEIRQCKLPDNFPIMTVDTKFYVYRGGKDYASN